MTVHLLQDSDPIDRANHEAQDQDTSSKHEDTMLNNEKLVLSPIRVRSVGRPPLPFEFASSSISKFHADPANRERLISPQAASRRLAPHPHQPDKIHATDGHNR